MKPKKEPLTPQEFHELPQSKKIHVLSLAYMSQCTAEGFSKAGLFKLRNYFGRIEPSNIQVFYDYIYSLPEPTIVNLYDIYQKSQAWQVQLRMSAGAPKENIEQYPSLLSFLDEL